MKTVIVGGGASGMLCAYFRSANNEQVILIEKNEKLGKKLYITGKGRCNLTNNTSVESFFNNVVSNPKFLLSSLYSFSPQDTINLFESLGLKTKTERGNRVFPLSDKSSDVIKTLEKALIKSNVDIRLNCEVKAILTKEGQVLGVKTQDETIYCDNVIIATGGLSYPSTGSTGDGYEFAKSVGHTVTKLYPSLTGINLNGEDFKSLQGLSLKNVNLTAMVGKKLVYSEQGEALFTHFGISGPLVLTLSSLINRQDFSKVQVSFDLKPALTEKQLDLRILRDFDTFKNKEFKNSLDMLLPKKLIPLIIKRCNVYENKKVNEITYEERQRLVNAIKNLTFSVNSLRGFNEAVVTSGGVKVSEINPSTMESKLIKGLYFIGEVLDVDAFTGGFNLQIAFSTAYTAGYSNIE